MAENHSNFLGCLVFGWSKNNGLDWIKNNELSLTLSGSFLTNNCLTYLIGGFFEIESNESS